MTSPVVGVGALGVLSVAKSAATQVALELLKSVDLSAVGTKEQMGPGFFHVSSAFAAVPERVLTLSRILDRSDLKGFVVNQLQLGLWADLIFAGTPICVPHIYQ